MMKIIGAFLIIGGCVGMASYECNKWKQRYLEVRELIECLQILEGQLRFCYATIPEALAEIEQRRGGKFGQLFITIAKKLNERSGEQLNLIWRETLLSEREGFFICKEDWAVLEELGRGLGYLDLEVQKRYVENSIKCLLTRLPEKEKKYKEKEKIIRSFGVICGVVILLILL